MAAPARACTRSRWNSRSAPTSDEAPPWAFDAGKAAPLRAALAGLLGALQDRILAIAREGVK
jgi:hypothetical protein